MRGYPFRITAIDAQGRPSAFEVARGNEDSDCVLWASPTFIDEKLPAVLEKRLHERTNPQFITKSRSVGISTYQDPAPTQLSLLDAGPHQEKP